VANHDPFNGIQDAIENQDQMRASKKEPFTPSEKTESVVVPSVKEEEQKQSPRVD